LVSAIRGSFCRGAVAFVVLGSARSLAAQPLEPTLLSYRAVDGCPEVAEFQRSVQRRSARVRFVDEGSHARELSITLSKEGDFTIGELRLIERDGTLRQRSVRFSSCPEAVEGLALITVVSLDPQALVSPPPEQPPPAPPTPPKPPAPVPVPPRKKSPAPPAPSAARPEVALGAQFDALFHVVPSAALGGELFVDVASPSRAWLSPLFRLSASHTERRGIPAAGSEANFTLTTGTLRACPLRLGDDRIVVRPCAFATGGALHAWGTHNANPQTLTRQFWAWGGSAQVFLRATQAVDIVADLGVGAPILRDQFSFQEADFWKTPALYLSSGVGLRFVFR